MPSFTVLPYPKNHACMYAFMYVGKGLGVFMGRCDLMRWFSVAFSQTVACREQCRNRTQNPIQARCLWESWTNGATKRLGSHACANSIGMCRISVTVHCYMSVLAVMKSTLKCKKRRSFISRKLQWFQTSTYALKKLLQYFFFPVFGSLVLSLRD